MKFSWHGSAVYANGLQKRFRNTVLKYGLVLVVLFYPPRRHSSPNHMFSVLRAT